jgi:hypothetical protein
LDDKSKNNPNTDVLSAHPKDNPKINSKFDVLFGIFALLYLG